MKEVLILGAGLVTRPIVRYLLDQPDFHVKVASRTVSKAIKLIDNHPQGEALELLVTDTSKLKELIAQTDLVISLVPYAHHPTIAKMCIEHKKLMVTTSYVSEAMQALDEPAKEAGVLILNEIGLDPGIDHMSAMKIIHQVQNEGGHVTSFFSYCGGLPAPEANTNPFGYKFSWSPRGVVLAGKNSGRYRKDGEEVVVPGEDLFSHYWTITIDELGEFEAYPNRNSLPYIETYGLSGIGSMYRGTLRNLGWCDTWKKMADLGLLDEEERTNLETLSFRQFIGQLVHSSPEGDLKKDLAAHLKIDEGSEVMKRLEWLGLLSDEPLPPDQKSPLDVLAARLLEKLQYEEGERDMIILHHDFLADYPDKKEKITSTLIDFGIPQGDSAMSRTVSLPAAVVTKLVLQGKIETTGVRIPVDPVIYEPVLEELEGLGITCVEKKEEVTS